MNAALKKSGALIQAPGLHHAEAALLEARQRGLQRMLQALFRERLLLNEHLIREGATAWLPLWSQQTILRFAGLSLGRTGDCQLSGAISYYRLGEHPQTVHDAATLLALAADGFVPSVAQDLLQRLIAEVDNSQENDVLCLQFRRHWAMQLVAQFSCADSAFLAALRLAAIADPVALLEQWGTLGHPWHPMHKSKSGLSADQVLAYSPEFHPVLAVPLAAIHVSVARVSMVEDVGSDAADFRMWFAQTYPAAWEDWSRALLQAGQEPALWLPLPLHPYQAQHVIKEKFAAELASGRLLILPQAGIAATPTMSFRTVAPCAGVQAPHLKLPVSLRMTSVQRTVSPKATVMGPRLTHCLRQMLEREQYFQGCLQIMPELVGLHYLDPDRNEDRSRHLSVLYRAHPASCTAAGLFAMPVATLFADSPYDGRPLVAEIVSLAYGDHAQGALSFYERYAQTVLRAVLGPYLLYGIAFEAHQQNSFIMLNADWLPVQLLVRDFGDLRIHRASLKKSGLSVEPYRTGQTVLEDEEPVRDKILHAVLFIHLTELGLQLARTYHIRDAAVYELLSAAIKQVFSELHDRCDPVRWEQERVALLESAWPLKSFLRMRLSDTSDDVHGQIPNPLCNTDS